MGVSLTASQFQVITGKGPIPGETVLELHGFDPALCVIETTEYGALSITQVGKTELRFGLSRWKQIP